MKAQLNILFVLLLFNIPLFSYLAYLFYKDLKEEKFIIDDNKLNRNSEDFKEKLEEKEINKNLDIDKVEILNTDNVNLNHYEENNINLNIENKQMEEIDNKNKIESINIKEENSNENLKECYKIPIKNKRKVEYDDKNNLDFNVEIKEDEEIKEKFNNKDKIEEIISINEKNQIGNIQETEENLANNEIKIEDHIKNNMNLNIEDKKNKKAEYEIVIDECNNEDENKIENEKIKKENTNFKNEEVMEIKIFYDEEEFKVNNKKRIVVMRTLYFFLSCSTLLAIEFFVVINILENIQ